MRPRPTPFLLLCCLLLGAAPALAGPRDARVGETRAVYRNTTLRATPAALGQAVATLPTGTMVVVRQVQLPWLEVEARVAGSPAPVRGWVKALETVEPQALQPNPQPVHVADAGTVSAQDAGAAGRQLDAATERSYRQSRVDLQRAYALVDELERATQAMNPADSVAFIIEGDLGRQGQDYARPPLLPPAPDNASSGGGRPGGGLGGLLGRAGGEVLGRLGVGGREGDALRAALETLGGLAEQLKKSFTPEQEYRLGRAVAANAIARYGVDPSPARRAYVRAVGDAIVRLSPSLAPTRGGYHFEVLDTNEVNAVSGPGGFVLVTRGAVEAASTEDELAAVLAHELAHVANKHGEATLRQSGSFQTLVQGLVKTGGAAAGAGNDMIASRVLEFFSGAVGEMSRTAMEHNYGRGLEGVADRWGAQLANQVFYDPAAMKTYLLKLASLPGHQGGATHEPPQVRAAALDPVLQSLGAFPGGPDVLAERRARFETRLGRAGPR